MKIFGFVQSVKFLSEKNFQREYLYETVFMLCKTWKMKWRDDETMGFKSPTYKNIKLA